MINSIKKVLVIGASGLVGKTLVLQLNALDCCEKIDVIVRREQPEFLAQKKFNKLCWMTFYCSIVDRCKAIAMCLAV